MAAPNILNVTTITGKTALESLTTTSTAILTNAAGSGAVYKINSIVVANIDGVNSADVSIYITRSATNYHLARTITIPADSTLVVLSKETSFYLEEGDVINGLASAAGDLQVLCSYEIII